MSCSYALLAFLLVPFVYSGRVLWYELGLDKLVQFIQIQVGEDGTDNSIARVYTWRNRVLQRALERLELLDAKVSRAVLRGGVLVTTSCYPTDRRSLAVPYNTLPFVCFLVARRIRAWSDAFHEIPRLQPGVSSLLPRPTTPRTLCC
jgi:hypothetical protein